MGLVACKKCRGKENDMTRQNRSSLDLLKKGKNLIGAEIGVQAGTNARWMLENLDIKKLYLIDPYEEYPCNNKERTIIGPFTEEKETAKALLEIYNDQIDWVYKYSWDALVDFRNNILDFVYIDGDHREESVALDMEYANKIKLGGLLCGHDWRFESVKNGIRKWVSSNQLKFTCCQKLQYVKVIDKHTESSDWWMYLPDAKALWSQKCSKCQNVYNFTIKDISFIN